MADNRFIKQPQGLGQLFGPGMGQGLQSLVTQQLDNMLAKAQPQERQTYDALQGVGFNPQQADNMSGYMTLEDLLGGKQPQNQPQMPDESVGFQREKPTSAAQRKEDASSDKVFRDWYTPIKEKAHEARRNKTIYREMGNLARSGNLWSGAGKRLLNKLPGGDYITNDDTDYFNKLKSNLSLTAANLLPKGTKITNYLERLATGILPNLEQSNDAIAGLADLNAVIQEMLEIEKDGAKELGKKWGYELPPSADIELEEITQKRMDKLEDEMFDIGEKISGGGYNKKRSLRSGDALSGDISEYSDRLKNGQTATRDGEKYIFDSSKRDFVPAKEWHKKYGKGMK